MKKVTFVALFLVLTGISASYAQMDAAGAMKTYNKFKGQYDGLVSKYKPYKDMAVKNSDKLSPDLKSSMEALDGQISSYVKKLDEFPNASATDQLTLATSLKNDYPSLKSSADNVIKQIKKLKLPKM